MKHSRYNKYIIKPYAIYSLNIIIVRYLFGTFGAFYACGINRQDTIYASLPLYHSAGGMMGVGIALVFGCTVVIKKKFSVSQFWTDCIRYKCTV